MSPGRKRSDGRQAHTKHVFNRRIAWSLAPSDGRTVFGCNHITPFGGCSDTEVRHRDAPSPFEMKLEQARRSQERRKEKVRGY